MHAAIEAAVLRLPFARGLDLGEAEEAEGEEKKKHFQQHIVILHKLWPLADPV